MIQWCVQTLWGCLLLLTYFLSISPTPRFSPVLHVPVSPSSWCSHPVRSVPSLVKFHLFHRIGNPYFYSPHHPRVASQSNSLFSPLMPSLIPPVSISACNMCMRSFLVEPRGCQVMFSPIAPPVQSISRGRKLEECLCSALFCVSLAGYTVFCFYMHGCIVRPHSIFSQIQLEYLV